MNILKHSLDKINTNQIIIENPIKKSRKNMNKLLSSIDKNYTLYNTDPISNIIFNNIQKPRTLIIKKEKITISKEINNLNDLIELLNTYPSVSNVEYNINLERIQSIKEPLIELNNLIGIHDLKSSILDQILFYIQDFHLKTGNDYMHTVIYGPPGTGKTEVAKIIGKIFSQLGILKNKTFRKVVRSDLIAGYLGQTAIKTTEVIQKAIGGVLFIDEAYALGNSEKRDSFSKECIDTLCEALSNHKENLMVIVAGYEEELNTCFFSYNQGLKSRFPWVFYTDKYTAINLRDIFIKKINDINWTSNIDIDLYSDFFEKNLKFFPYYGRDMEILLLKTKIAHSRRVFCMGNETKTIINLKDLDKGIELFKKHNQIKAKEPIYSMYM
jgi:SpoVK/Ycf46/Vps4 family AAA+-type ATPase